MTISAEPTSTRRAEENLQVAKRLLTSLLNADKDQAIGLINENFEMMLPVSVSPRPICGIGAFGKYVEAAAKVFVDGAVFEEINAVTLRDTVVLEVKVIGRAKSGRQYENLYVHWFELEAGKVSRWREYVDTKRAMELLS
ncbi:nuclear transport factor 2 family protein [Luminiphilus sp.]|jgi:ketosteroid isomerase-like protein|nr:nuclear transport factor 2 family protein [Luminiphilus sp.]